MLSPDQASVDRILREDVPYFDLTTQVLGLPQRPARMTFRVREPAVAAGLPMARGLLARCGAQVAASAVSGDRLAAGDVLLVAEGMPDQLHLAWKVCANTVQFATGIATRTRAVVEAARAVAPQVEVLATRKSIPGTKEVALEAVLAGGGQPHRLGLSETVLIFDQHTIFLGGLPGLLPRLPEIVASVPEKLVLVEVTSAVDAMAVAEAGAGGVQFDKLNPDALAEAVAAVRAVAPQLRLIAAGGINAQNAAAYAATGVDGLATSWIYGGDGVDVGVVIEPC
jgi:molybdenum transport protein